MARKYDKADPKSRYVSDREPSERIIEDGDIRGRISQSVTLFGDEMGKTPEELLEYALERLDSYEEKVNILLRHVPRKYEDKIGKLEKPPERMRRAINAVIILLVNQRTLDTIPDQPKDES